MGFYNPHTPQILGEEWVPIRDEDVVFSPAVNVVELGHRFSLSAAVQLGTARFYINDFPPAQVSNQVYMSSIYAAGTEDQTGPIRRAVIPCNAGGVTGSGFSGLTAANIPIFLANPSDGSYIECTPNADANQKSLDLFFATNAYAPLLAGKRILAVNLLHSFSWDPVESGIVGSIAPDVQQYTFPQALNIKTGTGSTTEAQFAPFIETYGNNLLGLNPPRGRPPQAIPMSVVNFGEINHQWSTPSTTQTPDRMPWRYEELQRFEISAGVSRYRVHYDFGGITDWAGVFYLNYAALEVIYCEEKRLAYGGKAFGGNVGSTTQQQYTFGTNVITLRDTSFNSNPVLPVGNYTVVVASPDIGDIIGPIASGTTLPAAANAYPDLNGVRELYQIPTHPGVKVNVSQTVDDVFTAETTAILPQISLHTTGGVPLVEPHVYGRQSIAQVYGTITATQEILDGAAGGAKLWPWVRYYARRFGDTTVPLRLDSPTITGSGLFVQITPNEFDALDEILDGWKEITLRFPTAPTMGTGANPQWRWSATGETSGNRWEVLGATAPALSGTPGNFFNTVASGQLLSSATYGQPSAGATVNEGWIPQYAPPVTATADDQTSDAVLIFAQDALAITGFTVTTLSQAVTGIGQNCGINPEFIPSSIYYNRLSWSPSNSSIVLLDTFSRSVTGWGTADTGQTYVDAGGTVPTDYIVNGSEGTHRLFTGAANVSRRSTISGNFFGSHQRILVSINDSTPVGAGIVAALMGNFTDANNFDFVQLRFNTTGTVDLLVSTRVGGSTTDLMTVSLGAFLAGQRWYLDIDISDRIRAKAWYEGALEPVAYQVEGAASFTSGGVGVRSLRLTGNTNTDTVISYDNYMVTPSTWNFGSYEIQRQDPLTEWQTIALATSPGVTGFNDYEARVSLQSDYRIRVVDVLGFPGPWSSTVSATIPAPGVVGTLIGANSHVLIFTTNEFQNGLRNLAYAMAWEESRIEEGFEFPEAGFNQLQPMFNRDFFVAFRPLERGGEQFSRTVLVQAAAISPETLADFTSLRDMAWESVPYICVRDEDANRWFANITVPNARVLRDRRLYLAPVGIAEVTDTASPVDPSWP